MIALVTGASQGIGAAVALRLAKEGYTVAVHSSNRAESRQKAEQVAQQCRELGAEAACFAADVSDYAQCDKLIKDVKAAYGRLDVLKAGTIYDIKRVVRYSRPKYSKSSQHRFYLDLFPSADRFTYLIYDGAKLHKETYCREECIPTESLIAEFAKWLKENGLFEVYKEKWTAKGE